MKAIFKTCLISLWLMHCFYAVSFSQNIGINNPAPHPSSILDLTSTTKGFLTPRMTTAERNAIASPATGLLVYDTSLNSFYYFDGALWKSIAPAASGGWNLTGNAGTNNSINFIGTTDNVGLRFKVNNENGGAIDHLNSSVYLGHFSGGTIMPFGLNNTIVGDEAGKMNSGFENSFFGSEAGRDNGGNQNSFYGYQSGMGNMMGMDNSYFGHSSAKNNSHNKCAVFGSHAGESMAGLADSNSYFGSYAGQNKSGNSNSIFGAYAGQSISMSSQNCYFGTEAGYANSSNGRNSFFGYQAGRNNSQDYNSFFGYKSGFQNLMGNENSYFGAEAGLNNTGGSGNSLFGRSAMKATNNGTFNTIFGNNGLLQAQSCTGNSVFGYNAGSQLNFNVNYNSFFGFESGYGASFFNTIQANSFYGYQSGKQNTSSSNSYFGFRSGMNDNNILDSANAYFGAYSGMSVMGKFNSFFGYRAGINANTINYSCIFGAEAGSNASNFIGENIYIGYRAGFNNSTGGFNTYVGSQSGFTSFSGLRNTFVGRGSGYNCSGSMNTFLGDSTGYTSSTGNNNTYIGRGANPSMNMAGNSDFNTLLGSNSNHSPMINNATAIGANASVQCSNCLVLGTNTTLVGIATSNPQQSLHVNGQMRYSTGVIFPGMVLTSSNASGDVVWSSLNTALQSTAWLLGGNNSVSAPANYIGTTGNVPLNFKTNNLHSGSIDPSGNTTFGYDVGNPPVSSNLNTMIGWQAGKNITGKENVLIGLQSGFFTQGSSNAFLGTQSGFANTSGAFNTFIGDSSAISNTSGSQNTIVGYKANVGSNSLINATAIGANAIVSASNSLVLGNSANVGIGTSAPATLLEVNGIASKPGGGTWTASSDARLKKDVMPYMDGLTSLMKIKPVKFHYNDLSGHNTNTEYIGVIAQELKEVAPYMVGTFKKDGTEYLNVDNSAMIYMLINAVKEQQQMIEELKARNQEMARNLSMIEK